MKTYCKGINITDYNFVFNSVYDYLKGTRGRPAKWRRGDYQKAIAKLCGLTKAEVKESVLIKDTEKLDYYVDTITKEIIRQIENEKLELQPIFYFKRKDPVNGKERLICHESPLQQVMDYVAVCALSELFDAKITRFQCASIPKRGQLYGKKIIERWIRRDKECKFYIKIDVVKCFPNIKKETIIALLKRDIHKNPKLIKFVEMLLSTYKSGGLEIGTYISAWLCNYVLSYAFRYADGLCYYRRNKRIKTIKHQLFYMDDMIFFGSNKKELIKAIKLYETYLDERFNLKVHDWQIYEVKNKPIDMMGFVISYRRTTIRKKVFIRARRHFLRAKSWLKSSKHLNLFRSFSVVSYFGFFKYSNSENVRKKLKVDYIVSKAKQTIAFYARKENIYAV